MARLRFGRPSPRAAALAATAVLAVGLLGGGAWWWAESQARRADAAYAVALGRLQDATAQQAPPEVRAAAVRELEAVLARHPSARLAPQAAYELGHVRYAGREWARARAAYEIALARAESPTLRALARIGIGYTWEGERNYARAIETYQTGVTGLKAGDFQYEELLLDLGRTQELAGKTAEAIETYRRVLRDVPRGLRVADARSRLASLGAAP